MSFLKNKTAIITGAGYSKLSDGRCGSIGYGIATAYAKKKNSSICSSSDKVKELFSDDTFRSVCGAHTTDFAAVKTRVEKACEILYGLKYES